MKIAVTGASGFVGRHVLAELARHQVEVVAASRDPARLPVLAAQCTAVQLDIAAPPADAFVRLGRPDVLIHLAWDGLPNYKSLHHFAAELPRQFNFLHALVEAGLPKLLVTGTCFEYGMQSGALAEDLEPQPQNPYGFAKDALRRELQFLQAAKPFALTWARLFYMFGDGQPAGSLYPQLQLAVAKGEKTFNMSGGEQLRDYLPVGEVARLLVALALTEHDPQIVNVCSGTPVAVRDLVKRWLSDNNWSIALNLGHYPYPDYEPMSFWGSTARLSAALSNR